MDRRQFLKGAAAATAVAAVAPQAAAEAVEWAKGDVIARPTTGLPGWVCLKTGTPGEWVALRVSEPTP